ncbi:DUF4974 domain-containing protein [Maribellus comscasis]|uniref:DUF4974 domain-containing protein n=1 Tax=Maribellus comscasis TaxID=2681766 RepID=A0A6I6JS25_9BACT|nr:FecR domain-containing protein [Maribellus comscasis]QGY44029.1 DUF4974 domain-containing protein [Maribellus comscasis]
MHQKFKKYISNSCTSEEYNEVKNFIGKKENDVFIDGLMHETWKDTLTKPNTISPDQNLLNLIHHKIALKENNPKRTVRIYQTISAVAAVLILGLILGIVFYPKQIQNNIVTQNISTPYGGKTHFTLSDGTEIWLNSGSSISYPSRFSDTREVTLKGEAYFKVTHNSHPFIVSGNFGEIEVLGTEFDVKAYDGEPFATTLVNGSIRYRNKDNQLTLKPGSQVTFHQNKMLTHKVETEIYTSWKDGKLIFRDEPLENIATRLERWYNVDIELKGEEIKKLRYNGTIELESFSEVLELIKVTTPIQYSFDRDTRILSISATN